MSITKCPHCEKDYDQDFEVEHEEMCKEPVNREAVKKLKEMKSNNPSGLLALSAMFFMGMLTKEQYMAEKMNALETRLK